jgi:hypothetical protein
MEQDELKDDLDFSGKVLLVYLAGQRVQDSIAIEYAKLETRAERLFLVGRIPEMEGQEWLSNCTTAIAWDSINQYIEFKTKKDYQERIRKGVKPTIRRKLGI